MVSMATYLPHFIELSYMFKERLHQHFNDSKKKPKSQFCHEPRGKKRVDEVEFLKETLLSMKSSFTSMHSNLEHGLATLIESFSPLKSKLYNLSW